MQPMKTNTSALTNPLKHSDDPSNLHCVIMGADFRWISTEIYVGINTRSVIRLSTRTEMKIHLRFKRESGSGYQQRDSEQALECRSNVDLHFPKLQVPLVARAPLSGSAKMICWQLVRHMYNQSAKNTHLPQKQHPATESEVSLLAEHLKGSGSEVKRNGASPVIGISATISISGLTLHVMKDCHSGQTSKE